MAIGDNQPGLQGGIGWGLQEKAAWVVAIFLWGGLGSLLDSALGGWLQASVIDVRSGKVVEGIGGKKVGFCFLSHGGGMGIQYLDCQPQSKLMPTRARHAVNGH